MTDIVGPLALSAYCTPDAVHAYKTWVNYPLRALYEDYGGPTVDSVARAFGDGLLGPLAFPLSTFEVRMVVGEDTGENGFRVVVDPGDSEWYEHVVEQISRVTNMESVQFSNEDGVPITPDDIGRLSAQRDQTFTVSAAEKVAEKMAVNIALSIHAGMSRSEQMHAYAKALAKRVYTSNKVADARRLLDEPRAAYDLAVNVARVKGLDHLLGGSHGNRKKAFFNTVATYVRSNVVGNMGVLNAGSASVDGLRKAFVKKFNADQYAEWIGARELPVHSASSSSDDDERLTIDCEYADHGESSDDDLVGASLVRNLAKRSKIVSFKLERRLQRTKPQEFSWTGRTALEPGDVIHTVVHASKKHSTVIIDYQMMKEKYWVVVNTVELKLPSSGTRAGTMFVVPLENARFRAVVSVRRPGAEQMVDKEGEHEFTVDPAGTKNAKERNYPVTWAQVNNARANPRLRASASIPEFVFHARLINTPPYPHLASEVGEVVDYFPVQTPHLLTEERERTLGRQATFDDYRAFIKEVNDGVIYKSDIINEVRHAIWASTKREKFVPVLLPDSLAYDQEYENLQVGIGDELNTDFDQYDGSDSEGFGELGATSGFEPFNPVDADAFGNSTFDESHSDGFGELGTKSGFEPFDPDSEGFGELGTKSSFDPFDPRDADAFGSHVGARMVPIPVPPVRQTQLTPNEVRRFAAGADRLMRDAPDFSPPLPVQKRPSARVTAARPLSATPALRRPLAATRPSVARARPSAGPPSTGRSALEQQRAAAINEYKAFVAAARGTPLALGQAADSIDNIQRMIEAIEGRAHTTDEQLAQVVSAINNTVNGNVKDQQVIFTRAYIAAFDARAAVPARFTNPIAQNANANAIQTMARITENRDFDVRPLTADELNTLNVLLRTAAVAPALSTGSEAVLKTVSDGAPAMERHVNAILALPHIVLSQQTRAAGQDVLDALATARSMGTASDVEVALLTDYWANTVVNVFKNFRIAFRRELPSAWADFVRTAQQNEPVQAFIDGLPAGKVLTGAELVELGRLLAAIPAPDLFAAVRDSTNSKLRATRNLLDALNETKYRAVLLKTVDTANVKAANDTFNKLVSDLEAVVKNDGTTDEEKIESINGLLGSAPYPSVYYTIKQLISNELRARIAEVRATASATDLSLASNALERFNQTDSLDEIEAFFARAATSGGGRVLSGAESPATTSRGERAEGPITEQMILDAPANPQGTDLTPLQKLRRSYDIYAARLADTAQLLQSGYVDRVFMHPLMEPFYTPEERQRVADTFDFINSKIAEVPAMLIRGADVDEFHTFNEAVSDDMLTRARDVFARMYKRCYNELLVPQENVLPRNKMGEFEDIVRAIDRGMDMSGLHSTFVNTFYRDLPDENVQAALAAYRAPPVEARISIGDLFKRLEQPVIEEPLDFVAMTASQLTHTFDKLLGAAVARKDPKYFGSMFQRGRRYIVVVPSTWSQTLQSIRDGTTNFAAFIARNAFEVPADLFSHSRAVELRSIDGQNVVSVKRTYSKERGVHVVQRIGDNASGALDTNVYDADYKVHTVKLQ